MALITKKITLDITPGAIPQVVNVSEYDENRQYTVSLIDDGGVFAIPSGTTAKVEGSIGGNAFSETATVSGNTITFTLTESMTAKAGDVWCKIKLVKDSKPIQTCAFILRCDRAGVDAEAVIGAPGFEEQINQGVAEYFDGNPPFFVLPSGGQSGQALLSDGSNGAYWGQAQSGGSGLTEDAKQALLDCFENVAWINDQGQTYYDALYAALYPPADLVSISAVFTQGSAVIYDTDSLDTLKQYLVVTATMSDSTTRMVTNYTLSGTLTVGTSTITASYCGKTALFNVVVTEDVTIVFNDPNRWVHKSGSLTANGRTWEEQFSTDSDIRYTMYPVADAPQNGFTITLSNNYHWFAIFFNEEGKSVGTGAVIGRVYIEGGSATVDASAIQQYGIKSFAVTFKYQSAGTKVLTADDVIAANVTMEAL